MFNCILNALLCGWFLSLFGIDSFVVEFMRTALNIRQATTSYYYVLCIALGVMEYCLK